MLQNISQKFYNIKNKYIRTKFNFRSISDSRLRNILNDNKKFKNIHKGKRCFIIGNGPSLKKENMELIRDEIVFTVNQIVKSNIYNQVHSNYHVVVDPIFFNFDKSSNLGRERLETFKKIPYDKNIPKCIFPYSQKDSIEKSGLNKILNTHYIYTNLYMTDCFNYTMDMTKNMPTANTVVQYAMFCAIYMGFSEIYLLGCDVTDFLLHFQNSEEKFNDDINNHAYKYTENDKKVIKENSAKSKEFILYNYARVFQVYRQLKYYCEKRQIKIVNLTNGGCLDVFEKDRLINIIKK